MVTASSSLYFPAVSFPLVSGYFKSGRKQYYWITFPQKLCFVRLKSYSPGR